MLLSKCAACNNTKSKFIKEQEASGLLNKETFKKIRLVDPLLFERY